MPSNLSEVTSSLAEKELRETKEVRLHALNHLKDWIAKNHDIANVRTDDCFLLRFLRMKKFSLPMAQQALLKWLNLRRTYPLICKNLNCTDPRLGELIDTGYLFVSPSRDEHGRRVVIYNVKKFDPAKYTYEDMARIHTLTYETLLEDEETQICGVVHAADLRGLTAAHVSSWPPDTFTRLVRWGEQSMPLRHKEIHLLNVPLAVRYVYDIAKAMISQKMSKRIMLHNTIESLSDKIGVKSLPKEYGGEVPMEKMVQSWKDELLSHKPSIQSLDKMDILSISGIMSSKKCSDPNNNPQNNFGLSGSFRKLEID